MWSQPSPPVQPAATRAADRTDVANHGHTMHARLQPFTPVKLATHDGRVWVALAIPGLTNLTLDMPQSMHMPHPYLPHPGKLGDDTEALADQTKLYPLRTLHRPAGGHELIAQAIPLGITAAVPFQVHDWLGRWCCVGGKMELEQGEDAAPLTVTLNHQRFDRRTGIIGIQYTVTADKDFATAAAWRFMSVTTSASETLSTSVFCPMVAVNAESGRMASLGFQVPQDRRNNSRYFAFQPSGATGTLLPLKP